MDHEKFMAEALKEAEKAALQGEVPVGAVVVYKGEIIGRGHNLRETLSDPTAHAEIVALREAAGKLKNWQLKDCALYVTVEPCPMCAGAIYQARIKTLVYGAPDLKAGAVDTLFDLVRNPRLNHRIEVISGVLAAEASKIITDFFREKRNRGKF